MKQSTVEKLRNELLQIKESGISVYAWCKVNNKDKGYINQKITKFKADLQNLELYPDILPLYELCIKFKINSKEDSGMTVTYNRDDNGNIQSYDIYYPVRDSNPFETTLSRSEAEKIFGFYTYYGGNCTARQVTQEFPRFTLPEIKKIFRCFHLTKDSSWAAPHILEEYTEEDLAQYRMNLKERAAFKYCDARQERDFTSQIKKMASEINSLNNRNELVKSLLNVEYEKEAYTPNIEVHENTGVICLSDLHIGAFNVKEGYLDLPEYNEVEINRRLDYIIKSIQNKNWSQVIVLNLGDNVDSYRKMTSSMSHILPCVMSDKEIAQMYLRVMMRFFNKLYALFEDVSYYSIGSGNHSSTWGWLLDITLSQQLNKEFQCDCYVSNNEIDNFNIGNTSFIYLHGKTPQDKGQFKGFPLNLDMKTQCWFNDFFSDTKLDLRKNKVILKGDLHQYSVNSVSSFDYINCPSIYGSSQYIVSNWGLTPWGCLYLEIDENGNYLTGLIRE